MSKPMTIYEVLEMLKDYHSGRCVRYQELSDKSADARTGVLLEHLIELDTNALRIVTGEMEQLDPKHSAFMISGPTISERAVRAAECGCSATPTFDQTLDCAFESDALLGELLHRLEGCSAAPSVLALAKRLRELEETKNRQLANFTRPE